MFFCKKCKEKNEWPDSTIKSFTDCEVCDEDALCFLVPSIFLPDPKPRD